MKVTLDLGKLLEDGKITREEHDRLLRLAAAGTGSLAFNILIGFGVIAVAAGAVALVPDPLTGIVIGVVVLGAGLALYGKASADWEVLANICVLVGALGLAAGTVVLDAGSPKSFLFIAALFAVTGAVARSGLLVSGSVLALSSSIGARTGYMHASYFLAIEEPTVTIVVFSLLALGLYQLSKMFGAGYERLCLVAARVSLLIVNFGFWIGSLWGDRIDALNIDLSTLGFVVLWAVALIGVGVWAARANRRWVVNLAAIFGAIHFYTQWFELLGPQPVAILLAGLLALAFSLALWRFNRNLFEGRAARPAAS